MQATPAANHDEQSTALPLRSHTILGVCEAIGEDFGFNPAWIRIPLAASVLWSITGAIAIYAALGVVVLASRLLFPNRKPASVAAAPAATLHAVESAPAPARVEEQEISIAA